jgi:aminoglycoside 3-N-acetyltransferase
MSERDAIKISVNGPVTRTTLIEDLETIGVQAGMTLLVHSSLSRMGWVCGGPVAVIQALETVLTSAGTLIMPTHSGDLSEPSAWENPPVDASWWETIRNTMPAFDADLTPTRGMGAIPESFRKQPGVLRSHHPQTSFASWGANAEAIVRDQSLGHSMGEHSPLARIYEAGGHILAIGVRYDTCTSLHLAEHRATYATKAYERCGAPIFAEGQRRWVTFEDLNYDADDFLEIGKSYETGQNPIARGTIGYADSTLIPQRALVDFAVQWIEQNRN